MEISKGNFAASCADICSLIERSSFAAIDLEMTGISSKEFEETPLNTTEQAYLAARSAAKRYSIIQVGLCLFEEDSSCSSNDNNPQSSSMEENNNNNGNNYHPSFLKKKSTNNNNTSSLSSLSKNSNNMNNNSNNTLRLIARPFNFFVFPSGAAGGSNDPSSVFVPRDVVISPDAASFLRNHGMDWSRWIDNGVSYCNRIEMIGAREKIWKRRDEEKAAAPRIARETRALLNDEQRTWLDSCLVTAATFVASESRAGAECSLPPIRNTSACVALRAAVNNDATLCGKINVSFRGRRGQQDCLLVRRAMSLEEEAQHTLLDAVGFTNIFHTLLQQRKPIIGHNCFSDWCFMMESFYEPLPPKFSDFKEQMRVAAPAIYDTKILCNGGTFSGPDELPLVQPGTFEQTHLGGLFKAFGGLGDTSSSSSSSISSENNLIDSSSSSSSSSSNPTAIGNQSSLGKLKITLPLGFQNYASLSSKGSSAHEAGFDALMTGAIFGHFLTKYHHTPLVDAAENKIALFRNMYALDLSKNAMVDRTSSSSPSSSSSRFTKKKGFGNGEILNDDVSNENGENTEISPSSECDDVFLPGRHELIHIKHSLGNNTAPIENALRSCVESVSFFFGSIRAGETGECLVCIGRAGVNNTEQQNATPQAEATKKSVGADGVEVLERPKAASLRQLNERIESLPPAEPKSSNKHNKNMNVSSEAENKNSSTTTKEEVTSTNSVRKVYSDEAALAVLRATTRTHLLAPHMQFSQAATPPPSFSSSSNNKSIVVNKQYIPPPPAFKMDEFKNRDVKSLFRKVVRRR